MATIEVPNDVLRKLLTEHGAKEHKAHKIEITRGSGGIFRVRGESFIDGCVKESNILPVLRNENEYKLIEMLFDRINEELEIPF